MYKCNLFCTFLFQKLITKFHLKIFGGIIFNSKIYLFLALIVLVIISVGSVSAADQDMGSFDSSKISYDCQDSDVNNHLASDIDDSDDEEVTLPVEEEE